MKIITSSPHVVNHVTVASDDQSETYQYYRRTGVYIWECLMYTSWEPVYPPMSITLEKMFIDYHK